MLNEILLAIEHKQTIIIFGCTETGRKLYVDIKNIDATANVCFTDNSLEKQNKGERVGGGESICVIKPELISTFEKDSLVIIASQRFYDEMEEQLLKVGVNKEKILFHEACLKQKIKKQQQTLVRRTPKKRLNFVVDIAEHCNLNCQNCDHFSPLSKEFFMKVKTFEQDVCRMYEIFDDEQITEIDLEGGEPLLHEQITEFIEICHSYFPKAQVKIFTNGILLPDMNEEFWDICRKHEVVLEVTKYPINFRYDSVEILAEKQGVKLEYFNGGEEIKTSMHKPIDIDGTQDKYESFHNCYMANDICTDLKKGKLYPCTFAANLHIFNRYFEKDIKIDEKDYIDIYSDVSAEEIFEFLSNPISACRFCKVKEWTYDQQWSVSRKDIREWT